MSRTSPTDSCSSVPMSVTSPSSNGSSDDTRAAWWRSAPGGIPFPTTCYLTSPEAVKAVSHIEAEGRMRAYNELLHDDETVAGEYRGAHRLYVAFRHELAVRLGDDESRIANVSAGGMPERVKCLHALLAQTLVMGEGINPIGDRVLEAVTEEFSPSVCRCGSLDD